MLYDPDEKSIFQEQRVILDKGKRSGTLILTNKRLAVESVHMEKHRLTKDKKIENLLVNIPLPAITRIEVVKKIVGKPDSVKVIYTEKETTFDVSDPNLWADRIAKAKSEHGQGSSSNQQQTITQGQQQMSSQGVNVGQGVTVNLGYPLQGTQPAMPTNTVEKQVVKIRCSNCRTLYDENISNCPSCGKAN